jgi:hypothetical protein
LLLCLYLLPGDGSWVRVGFEEGNDLAGCDAILSQGLLVLLLQVFRKGASITLFFFFFFFLLHVLQCTNTNLQRIHHALSGDDGDHSVWQDCFQLAEQAQHSEVQLVGGVCNHLFNKRKGRPLIEKKKNRKGGYITASNTTKTASTQSKQHHQRNHANKVLPGSWSARLFQSDSDSQSLKSGLKKTVRKTMTTRRRRRRRTLLPLAVVSVVLPK